MVVPMYNTAGEQVGAIELPADIFEAPINGPLMHQALVRQQANARRGTHSTKSRGEVSRSKSKWYRQKGTGRARHGSNRAMNMRGGGVVHGPRPRDHGYKMPRKMVQVALRSALSLRTAEKKLHVIDGWAPATPKTKEAAKVLSNFEADWALVVDSRENENLYRSLRNLPHVKFLAVEGLNVYDVLRYEHVFVAKEAIGILTERLKTSLSRKEQALKADKAEA